MFSISYVYKAIDSFSPVARSIKAALEAVNKKADSSVTAFKKLGNSFREFNAGISTDLKTLAASAAAYVGIRDLTMSALDFQDAMADLSAITGATGKDLSFLGDQAMQLAASANVSQAEVANAIKLVASAKSELLKDPKGLIEVTKQILLLRNASGIDLAQAAEVATQSLNQFGAGADQAKRFVNVLAAGAKVGAAEIADVGVSVVKSGVAANMAKVSFEDLNAMIQVLAKNGIKGEAAGTGLKTALLKMESSGIRKIQPSVVGVATAFENMAKANLNAQQMQQLFGLEAIATGGALIRNAALIRQWSKEMTGTDVATEQANIRLGTLRVKLNEISLSIKEKFIKLFLQFEPTITEAVNSLVRIGSAVSQFAAEHPKLVKFTMIIVGVSAAIFALGAAITVVTGIISLMMSPITLVVLAISGLVMLISEFSGRWDELPGVALGALKSIFNFILNNNPISLLIDAFIKFYKMVTEFDFSSVIPDKLLSVLGFEVPPTPAVQNSAVSSVIAGGPTNSKVDINLNIKDNSNSVEKVTSKSTGTSSLNVGRNM